ncbi:hypothetical protein [Pseudoduganella lutea]|uniref:Uncharacterized protein n=1 Tax=Pseudoduganella lutea TaxID=321985 RepID=A0A4P6L0F7_9BURK|nr:hypothetical protein [Pseudoduganella lutea]QBE64098.1 hypothetical protein EWM63_14855 [Pseudoduganella lutea]
MMEMDNLYEMLLGCPWPPQQADAHATLGQPFGWDAADGAGPDRLFNRYRRLRLSARDEPAAEAGPTARCPAAPSAGRA